MADMMGQNARPLVDALGRHVMASERVHADDTVVPVLEPGLGRMPMTRLRVYVRDNRPFAGSDPAPVFYRYTPDRKSEHLRAHLREFRRASSSGRLCRVCQAIRRLSHRRVSLPRLCPTQVLDVHEATKSPLTREAFDRLCALYRIENTIRARPPDQRLAVRTTHTAPLMNDDQTCLR